MKVLVILVIALLIAVVCYFVISNWLVSKNSVLGELKYGDIVKYKGDKLLQYPDFAIQFKGIKQEYVQTANRTFQIYEFELTDKAGVKQQVNWSVGMGEIGPASFQVQNQKFMLELKSSTTFKDLFKKIPEGSFIITPYQQWKKLTDEAGEYLNKQD